MSRRGIDPDGPVRSAIPRKRCSNCARCASDKFARLSLISSVLPGEEFHCRAVPTWFRHIHFATTKSQTEVCATRLTQVVPPNALRLLLPTPQLSNAQT